MEVPTNSIIIIITIVLSTAVQSFPLNMKITECAQSSMPFFQDFLVSI